MSNPRPIAKSVLPILISAAAEPFVAGEVKSFLLELPADVNVATVFLEASTHRDPEQSLRLVLDISLDTGATWASGKGTQTLDPFPLVHQFIGGMTTKQGAPVANHWLRGHLGAVGRTGRQLRVDVLLEAGALLTSAVSVLFERDPSLYRVEHGTVIDADGVSRPELDPAAITLRQVGAPAAASAETPDAGG